MLRTSLMLIAAASCLAFAPEAAAQKGEVVSAPTLVGSWSGVVDWNDDTYDGTVSFEFRPDGTFIDPNGDTGTWRATATGIEIQYPEGGRTRYVGNLIVDMLIGTMQTNPADLNGLFALRRSN